GGEELEQRRLGEELQLEETLAEAAAEALLEVQRLPQRVLGDEPLVDEALAEGFLGFRHRGNRSITRPSSPTWRPPFPVPPPDRLLRRPSVPATRPLPIRAPRRRRERAPSGSQPPGSRPSRRAARRRSSRCRGTSGPCRCPREREASRRW